ncbi:MAG: ornithine cyclodeaminase [Rhizobiaceae bacterium]
MVNFIGTRDIIALTKAVGLDRLFAELVSELETDFRRWPEFEKAPRVPSHSANGVIELMPTSDGETYGLKFVNGHPGNTHHGLQTVTAFGVLADVATGYPTLLSEMTVTTALRTAATSAMAAKHLARPDSSVMALIGLGAQSEFQAHAFRAICGIKTIRTWDIDPEAMRKFNRNMAASGLTIINAASAEEAVQGADIITTVTADKTNATILSGNMAGAGVHINAVGGDCPGKTELARDILLRADIFVEFPPQTRIEGEIQQLAADHPVTELWEVIAGVKPGRTSAQAITLFDSVGFAIEDFSALRVIRRLAMEYGLIRELDLLPLPANPKDLFGVINAGQTLKLSA